MRTSSRSFLSTVLWHGLALVAIGCVPAIQFGAPWWQIPKRRLLPAAILMAAYAVSAALVTAFVRREGWRAAGQALLMTLSVFGLCLFGMQVLKIEVPRYLLVCAFLVAIVLVPLSATEARARTVGWLGPVLASAAAALFVVRVLAFQPVASHDSKRSYIKTAFYTLQVAQYSGIVPQPATRGGGLDRIGHRVLLGTGDGHLYLLEVGTSDQPIRVHELPTIVPANREEFAATFGGSSRSPKRSIDWTEKGAPRVQTWRFRVADVIAREKGDRVRLYASHHYWHADRECFVVRVSTIEGRSADLEGSLRDGKWETLYETTPCVPLKGERRKRGKNPFKGEEVGGRLALPDENTLLLTVGDHGFYGLESLALFAQDPNGSYGKTIRIDLSTRHAQIFTAGHRNPQGIFAAPDNRIWLTEHGSQGGDELNLLSAGGNYGWPLVTYGTEYGAAVWPLSQQQGRHDGYVQPVYAWTPSIGVTSLVRMTGDAFPIWRGDLIVGSLATKSLYRLVLDGSRVVLSEPIALDHRVRDVLELSDGRLLVWSDDASLLLVEQASGRDGQTAYAQLCLGCHQAVDGLSHRIGPDLFGIVDRGIGDAPGYDEFSPALRAHTGTWTRSELDAFLRDPQAFAPGTTMAFAGVPDDKLRAELIDYLAGFKEK